jgi:hypothetical protein
MCRVPELLVTAPSGAQPKANYFLASGRNIGDYIWLTESVTGHNERKAFCCRSRRIAGAGVLDAEPITYVQPFPRP